MKKVSNASIFFVLFWDFRKWDLCIFEKKTIIILRFQKFKNFSKLWKKVKKMEEKWVTLIKMFAQNDF